MCRKTVGPGELRYFKTRSKRKLLALPANSCRSNNFAEPYPGRPQDPTTPWALVPLSQVKHESTSHVTLQRLYKACRRRLLSIADACAVLHLDGPRNP